MAGIPERESGIEAEDAAETQTDTRRREGRRRILIPLEEVCMKRDLLGQFFCCGKRYRQRRECLQ